MTDFNENLYTTGVESASAESVKSASAEVSASSNDESSASSSASAIAKSSEASSSSAEVLTSDEVKSQYEAQLQSESPAERTHVDKLDDTTENVTFTEKDGTQVLAQIQAPSYKQATIIDARRNAVISDDGESMVVMTPDKYQEALAGMVKMLTVNGRPFGRFGFSLADKGHVSAYRAIIGECDSFLTGILNADN